MTLDYLLLDLDGTLLDFNMDEFIRQYLLLIQKQFVQYPFAKSVPQWILEGTGEMLTNEGTMTNKDKFLHYFQEKTQLPEDKLWEIFIHFYDTDFELLAGITQPIRGVRTFINRAQKAGYGIVIATQPVFPRVAIEKRLTWAGLGEIDAAMITHIENMSYCKPARGYFEQILAHLQTSEEKCLMIGNDIGMDMSASQYGFKVFYLQHKQKGESAAGYSFKSGNLNVLQKILKI